MTTPVASDPLAPPPESSAQVPLRVFAGVGGFGILLVSALFTLGVSLVAPFGMFLGRRLALRRGRPFTSLRSWIAAVIASTGAVLLALFIILSFVPADEWRKIQQEIEKQRVEQEAKDPSWMPKPDPVTEKIVQSQAFTIVFGVLGAVLACVFFGVVAGTPGWGATLLLSYAVHGRILR